MQLCTSNGLKKPFYMSGQNAINHFNTTTDTLVMFPNVCFGICVSANAITDLSLHLVTQI